MRVMALVMTIAYTMILLGLLSLITGCASIEGGGFSNSGAYQGQKMCVEKRGNVERWRTC